MYVSLFPCINPFGLSLELVRLRAVGLMERVEAGGGMGWAGSVLHWDVWRKRGSEGLFLDLSKKGSITNGMIKYLL